jgi:signal peptidase I
LLVGDYLFVSKMSYGYSRHSMPFSLPWSPATAMFETPERGEVAVFAAVRRETDYIKRIIDCPATPSRSRAACCINGQAVNASASVIRHQDTQGVYHNTVLFGNVAQRRRAEIIGGMDPIRAPTTRWPSRCRKTIISP